MIQYVFNNPGVLTLLVAALAFSFSNGFRDSSSIVATVVSTRALSPNMAFFLSAIFEFSGALLIGTAVAATIGSRADGNGWQPSHHDIVVTSIIAVGVAGVWGVISWWRAWPTSNGHALLGGLTGAGLAAWGSSHIQNKTVLFIGLVLVASPLLGCFVSFGLTRLLRWMGGWLTVRAKPVLNGLHVMSCMFVSCAHGSNDGQLVMGVLLPVLASSAGPETIPFGLRLSVAVALSLGVLVGGRRILKKIGMSFYRVQSLQGLSAEMTSAGTVLACSLTGFPASTTQVIAGSIMGSAAAENVKRARWSIAQEIALSWVVTFPLVGFVSYVVTIGFFWMER